MRISSLIVLVVGAVIAIFALSMNVSVDTGYGAVNNIGLMNDRQNYLIIAGIAVIAGLLLVIFGGSRTQAVIATPSDPFDAIDERNSVDRKHYAISLGVKRIDGIYTFESTRYADLETAISAAEMEQPRFPNTPEQIAKAELEQQESQRAGDIIMFKIMGVIIGLIALLVAEMWLAGVK